MDTTKRVGPAGIAVAIVLLVLVLGFLWFRFLGSPIGPQQGPSAAPAGVTPNPGDARFYRGGPPPGVSRDRGAPPLGR